MPYHADGQTTLCERVSRENEKRGGKFPWRRLRHLRRGPIGLTAVTNRKAESPDGRVDAVFLVSAYAKPLAPVRSGATSLRGPWIMHAIFARPNQIRGDLCVRSLWSTGCIGNDSTIRRMTTARAYQCENSIPLNRKFFRFHSICREKSFPFLSWGKKYLRVRTACVKLQHEGYKWKWNDLFQIRRKYSEFHGDQRRRSRVKKYHDNWQRSYSAIHPICRQKIHRYNARTHGRARAFRRVRRWNRTVIRMIYTRWTVGWNSRSRSVESYFGVACPPRRCPPPSDLHLFLSPFLFSSPSAWDSLSPLSVRFAYLNSRLIRGACFAAICVAWIADGLCTEKKFCRSK